MPNTDADFYSLEQFAKDIEARREKGRLAAENFRNLMAEVYKEKPPVAPVADEPKPLVSPSFLNLMKSGAMGTVRTAMDAPETAMAAAGNLEARKRIIEEQHNEAAPRSWNDVHGVSDFADFLGGNAAYLAGSAAPAVAAGALMGAPGGPVGMATGASAGLLWGLATASGLSSTREAIQRAGQSGVKPEDISGLGAVGIGALNAGANFVTGSVAGRALNATGLNKAIPSSIGRFMAETPAKMESDVLANAIKRSTLSTAAREGASAGGINAAAAAGTEALMQIQAGEPINQKAILDAATGQFVLGASLGSVAGGLGAASHRNAAIAERARRTPSVISALDAEDMRSGMNANAPTGSTGPTIPPSGPPVAPPFTAANSNTPQPPSSSGGGLNTANTNFPLNANGAAPIVNPPVLVAANAANSNTPQSNPIIGGIPTAANVNIKQSPITANSNIPQAPSTITPQIFLVSRGAAEIGSNITPNVPPRAANTNVPEVAKPAIEPATRAEPVAEAVQAPEVIADHLLAKTPTPLDEAPAIKPADIAQEAPDAVAEAPVSTPPPAKAGTDTVTPVFNFLTSIQEGGGKTPSLATVKKIALENEVNVRENPDGKPATVKSILEDLNTHILDANGEEFASRYKATGTIPTLPPRLAPSAAPVAPPTRTPEQIAKSVEKVQGVLENLKKASKTGENLHSALVDALNNQDLSHEQVAAAFNIAHTLNQVLPGNAKHNIQFVHELFAQPNQAGALAKSGGTMGESVQGSRMAPTAALEGLIKISLEGKHSSYLVETASHEAFHVLQDYFAKHDPKFARALDNGFKSKDGSGTLTLQEIDPTIIRKLERTKAPDGESYWKNLTDSIGDAKLSPREAQAYAFGALFDAATRGKPMAGVLPVYARFINMVKEFAQRAGNALRGDGFRNASDVMEMGVNGKAKARYDAMESPVKGQPVAPVDDTEFSARKPKPVAAPTAATQASATTPASGATQASGPASIGQTRPVPALPGERGIMRQIADKISGDRKWTYTKDLSGASVPVEESFWGALARNMQNVANPAHAYDAARFNAGRIDVRSVGEAIERSMSHGGRTDSLLEFGAPSINRATGEVRHGDYTGAKGLSEIFSGLASDDIKPLQDYLTALRERDLRANNRKGMTALTDAEINSTISGAKTEFTRIASDLDVFNKALMDFAVDSGILDAKAAAHLKSMFYTPFYRLLEADPTKVSSHVISDQFSKAFGPNLKQPNMSAFTALKGSEQGIGGLFENIIRNADSIMKAGLKNDAMGLATKYMQEDGLATRLPPGHPVTKDVIVVRENGQNVKYSVQDPLLYATFVASPPVVRGIIHNALASYGRFLRTSITSTPGFIINSLWKGKLTAYVQEGSKAFTGPIADGTLASIRKGWMGGASQRAIMANTGYGQGTFGMGSGAAHEKLARATRVSAGEANLMDRLHQVGGAIAKVNSAVEMAERIRIYDDLIKRGSSVAHAAQEAYRMAPYARRGAGEGIVGQTVSALAPIVPFLNAKIQSNFRVWEKTPQQKRTFGKYGLPEGMMTRLAVLTAFSTAAAAYSSQDPRWKTITADDKGKNDILLIPDMPMIALPRPYEYGALSAIAVLGFDAAMNGLPENYKQMFATMYGATVGGYADFIPPGLKTGIEVATNHSFFTGRPLESKTSANLPASERTGPNVTTAASGVAHATNAIAEGISKAIPGASLEGLSPTVVQHTLEGLLGGLGAQAMIAMDVVLGAAGMIKGKPNGAFGEPSSPAQMAMTVSQMNRIVKDPLRVRNSDEEKFYELYGKTTEAVALLSRMQRTGNAEKYQALVKDPEFVKRYQVGKALAPYSKAMSDINAKAASVENSSMDSAKKREEILRLQGMRAQLANQAMRLYTQYESSKR